MQITFKDNINYLYTKLFKSKIRFSKIIFIVLLCLSILLESGSRFIVDLDSTRYKIIILGLMVLLLIILFLSRHNFISQLKTTFNSIKQKTYRPSFSFVFVLFFSFVVLLSFILCSDKSLNVYSYINFIVIIFSSYMLCKSTTFKEFGRFFVNVLSIICVVSLIFYFLLFNTNYVYGTQLDIQQNYIIQNYLFLFYDFGNGLPGTLAASASDRNMAIFWEPGVFGTIILIGLVFELFFLKEEKNYYRCILFVISLLTTFSTAAFLIVPFIIYFSFFEIKQLDIKKQLLIIGAAIGVVFLGFSLWYYQDKIFSGSFSLITRLNSLFYHLQVMIRSPFLGVGPVSANGIYYEISNGQVDAATSTIGYFLSGFGIFFIFFVIILAIAPFFRKDISLPGKLFLTCFILALFEKEIQVNIFISFAFILMFTFDSIKFKWENKQNLITSYSDSTIGKIFGDYNSVSKNVGLSFIVKIISLIVGLITIPIYSLYFGNDTYYGVWLTIISVLSFITIFDFGFSNGLRTKLSISLQQKNLNQAKEYISATYSFSTIVSGVLLIILSILAFTLNWNDDIYNIGTNVISRLDLSITIFIVFITVCLQFVFRTIVPILDSIGESAIGGSLTLISNVILLIFAIVGSLVSFSDKFIILACMYFVATLLPLFIATYYVFSRRLPLCKPDFKKNNTHWKIIKSLIGLNVVFFIVQISNLFLTGMNDYIITFIFGDTALVTQYSYYYKIFNFITSGFASVFQPPFWVAIARAYANNDMEKVNKLRKILTYASIFTCFIIVLISVMMPFIFEIWLGNSAPDVSWYVVIIFCINDIITCILLSQQIVANGLGLVKYQAIVFGIAAICKIPLVILYNHLFGSVLSFSIVVLSNFSITWILLVILPIALNKFLRNSKINSKRFNCKYAELRMR